MKPLQRVYVLVEETVPAVLLMVLVASVAYAVVMRYAFDRPPIWENEFAVLLFIWQLFLGGAGAARRHLHLGVEILVSLLPRWARAVQELVVSCFVLVVLGFFIFLATKLALHPSKRLEMLGLGYAYVYWAVPVGFTLTGIHILEDIVMGVRALAAREVQEHRSSLGAYTDLQTEKAPKEIGL